MSGSLSPLTEWQRNELTGICGYWVAALSEAERNRGVTQILDAFHAWKQSQTDQHGMVRVVKMAGLISPPLDELRPADNVLPWQCAGPNVHDEIGLAFHVWLAKFAPFQALISEHGLAPIFALTGAMCWNEAQADSLIRINGFLTACLIAEAQYDAKHATKHRNSTRHLPKARRRRAEKSCAEAAARKVAARQMAIEYWLANPDASKKTVIDYLRRSGLFPSWKADSSFDSAIDGMKSKALVRLSSRRRQE
jgi:hypothetical protein